MSSSVRRRSGGSWLEGAGRSTPRTRPCAGSPTSSGCRRRPVASSSPAGRSATSSRWSRPGIPPGRTQPQRPATVAGRGDLWLASSIQSALDVGGRRVGPRSPRALAAHRPGAAGGARENDPATFFAVVATCGTTELLASSTTSPLVAEVCREHGPWFHVDGAYGGAGLAAPSVRTYRHRVCRLVHRRPAQVALLPPSTAAR